MGQRIALPKDYIRTADIFQVGFGLESDFRGWEADFDERINACQCPKMPYVLRQSHMLFVS